MRKTLLLLVSVFVLAACAATPRHFGTPIASDKVALIKKGTTTRTEVEQLLGGPGQLSIMPDGRRMAMYQYVETVAPTVAFGTAHIKQTRSTLQIYYDKVGKVEDYAYASTDSTADVSNFGGYRETSSHTVTK